MAVAEVALPGFSYHQRPFEIQPVVTTSGLPSWLTSMVHSPQSEMNSLWVPTVRY
jgi:hypothetical protein